jgi:hypothetical protein
MVDGKQDFWESKPSGLPKMKPKNLSSKIHLELSFLRQAQDRFEERSDEKS